MAAVVQIENLKKEFGNVRALDGVSFSVEEGEWIAIMGPSGSGKTTLINILGGLDTPTSGKAVVGGIDVARLDEKGLTRFRAEKIGFVFQQFHLVPYLTALENVMLAQYFHSTTDETEARAALKRVGLEDRVEHLPSQLSGGEQQRVAVARALINHPKLILADEPTGNLDESNQETVIRLLRELHDEGHTILMVTHDPSIGQLADRRIDLAHGRLAQITEFSAEQEIKFDHLLEQVWLFSEKGATPEIEGYPQQPRARPRAPDFAAERPRPPRSSKKPGDAHPARRKSRPRHHSPPPPRRAPAHRYLFRRRGRSRFARLQVRAHHQHRARPAHLHLPRPSKNLPARQSHSPRRLLPIALNSRSEPTAKLSSPPSRKSVHSASAQSRHFRRLNTGTSLFFGLPAGDLTGGYRPATQKD